MNFMNRKQKRIFYRNKTVFLLLVIFIDLFVPCVFTMAVTGRVEQNYSGSVTDGRRINVHYKNAVQSVDVNRFLIMAVAARFSQSQETEVIKAQCVMLRTDIYRCMGGSMQADSTSLGIEFMTEKQMKNEWKENYQENYDLIADCVAATDGCVIMYNNNYINAKYTQVSCGKTLSGREILGEEYAYLAAVECSEDIKSSDYLRVETISNKTFVKKIESVYEDAGLQEDAPLKSVQIVSKTEEGYVTKIQVGNVIMSGTEFVKLLGISSAAMTLEAFDDSVKITTKGVGDGFGVSIYTADLMAKQGNSYEQILKTFYGGITIVSQ